MVKKAVSSQNAKILDLRAEWKIYMGGALPDGVTPARFLRQYGKRINQLANDAILTKTTVKSVPDFPWEVARKLARSPGKTKPRDQGAQLRILHELMGTLVKLPQAEAAKLEKSLSTGNMRDLPEAQALIKRLHRHTHPQRVI